jgi:hypothetical protein
VPNEQHEVPKNMFCHTALREKCELWKFSFSIFSKISFSWTTNYVSNQTFLVYLLPKKKSFVDVISIHSLIEKCALLGHSRCLNKNSFC